jgi:hypothetical protein
VFAKHERYSIAPSKWSSNTLPNPVADTELPEWKFDEQRAEVRLPTAHEVRDLITAAYEEDPGSL